MFNIESVLNLQTIGTQLLQSFLPETTICLVVLYLLTVLAIELGEKRSKRALALETLNAIRFALLPIIGMYLYMLLSGDYSEIQTALNGYFYNSQYSITLKLLLLICAFVVVHSSEDYMRRHTMHLLEYPIVLATAILFMLLLASANHLISAFLTLVGFSLNLYVLIYSDAPVKVAREAGIKYYYLSTFSSGLLIYGCFVIYSLLGTGNFEEIALLLRGYQEASHNNLFLALGFSYLLGGLFFKLSAFPGHL